MAYKYMVVGDNNRLTRSVVSYHAIDDLLERDAK